MKYGLVLYIVLVLCGLSSCKKDQTPGPDYPILTPLPYFPAFPNSHWKYVDSKGDTTVSKVSQEYTLATKQHWSDDTATYRVSVCDGIIIWGYEANTGPVSYSGSYPYTLMLSDVLPVGSSWTTTNWGGSGHFRKIMARDSSLLINGHSYSPTIVVDEFPQAAPGVLLARRYFTRDVGLVKEELFSRNANGDTIKDTKSIFDFFIDR